MQVCEKQAGRNTHVRAPRNTAQQILHQAIQLFVCWSSCPHNSDEIADHLCSGVSSDNAAVMQMLGSPQLRILTLLQARFAVSLSGRHMKVTKSTDLTIERPDRRCGSAQALYNGRARTNPLGERNNIPLTDTVPASSVSHAHSGARASDPKLRLSLPHARLQALDARVQALHVQRVD